MTRGRKALAPVTELATHPRVAEITGVLGTLPHLSADSLAALGHAFKDSAAVTAARAAALDVDVPLVVDVLAHFSAVAEMFAPELTGKEGDLDPALVRLGLHAVCDAVAGTYAAPTIGNRTTDLLLAPWREVLGDPALAERHAPDLGPRAHEIDALLRTIRGLRTRCHDDDAAAVVDRIVEASERLDRDAHADADEIAELAAHLTNRQRVRVRLRRQVAQALSEPCPHCGGRPAPRSAEREVEMVLQLAAGAVQALLVADILPDDTLAQLLRPLQIVGV